MPGPFDNPVGGAAIRVGANEADLSSDYWRDRGSTQQNAYKGADVGSWSNEIERTGLHIQQIDSPYKGARAREPITKPTGELRPGDEHSSPKPHQATISTFRPTLANASLPDYAGQLQVLDHKLRAIARPARNHW